MLTYQLSGKALEVAAEEWLQYLKNYDEISGVFDKHSPENTGFVDKAQLKSVCQLMSPLLSTCVCVRARVLRVFWVMWVVGLEQDNARHLFFVQLNILFICICVRVCVVIDP
jgi:cytoskeletal protein RodZ